MNEKINKNFFKQLLTIFLCILAANYIINISLGAFSQKAYQKYYHSLDKYLPEYNEAIIERLFDNYEPHIDTSNIPKTFKEYKLSDIKYKTGQSYGSIYNPYGEPFFNTAEYFIHKKYIRKLEPKFHKTIPHVRADLYPFKNTQLFYNKYGELIYILKARDSLEYYLYDSNGELREVIIQCVNDRIAYNSQKQILYLIDDWNYVTLFNRYVTYQTYLIKLNIFICATTLLLTLIFILFKLCKIYNFPPKVSEKYLDIFQNKNNSKNFFQCIYYKILKTKIHLWSHLLTLIGCYSLLWMILIFIPFFDILGILTSSAASIILFGFIIIETIFFRKYRIKWKFVYENKIYNNIWHVGIIGYIIFIIFAIIHIL